MSFAPPNKIYPIFAAKETIEINEKLLYAKRPAFYRARPRQFRAKVNPAKVGGKPEATSPKTCRETPKSSKKTLSLRSEPIFHRSGHNELSWKHAWLCDHLHADPNS